eukprot:gene5013-8611_t
MQNDHSPPLKKQKLNSDKEEIDTSKIQDVEYDFEYEDDFEENDEENIVIENEYYIAKAESDKEVSKILFEEIIAMKTEKWSFKSLKQMIKLLINEKNYKEMIIKIDQLLEYSNIVTKNEFEKSILKILNFLKEKEINFCLLEKIYKKILNVVNFNKRLSFKIKTQLGESYIELNDYKSLFKLIKELHHYNYQKGDIEYLEILALEIQYYTEKKNMKELKKLHEKATQIKGAISHPRIMGIIKECAGKILMKKKKWEKAIQSFFEAFKNFTEIGDKKNIICLKYLLIVHMLSNSEINPFEANELKFYTNDKEISIFIELLKYYQSGNFFKFQNLFHQKKEMILEEKIISKYFETLLKELKKKSIVELLKSYSRIKLRYISKELNIEENELEMVISQLILDKEVNGKLNHVDGIFELKDENDELCNTMKILNQLVFEIHPNICRKIK